MPRTDWTFLTNHTHVLLCIAQDAESRMRDVAERVGITERAVQRIVSDLVAGGYLRKVRDGRRNRYQVQGDHPLRHPVERHRRVSALLHLLDPQVDTPAAAPGRDATAGPGEPRGAGPRRRGPPRASPA